MLQELFQTIDLAYLFLSALLFMIGLYLGPVAVEREISFLLKYPRWMLNLMNRYFKSDYNFLIIFLLIFFLNNFSLFSSFVSGFLIIGPPIAAFLTGFHVSVISFEMMGWQGVWHILINPVAWLEFPAAWISFSLGFELAKIQFAQFNWPSAFDLFNSLLPVYLKYVFTLLFLAAILETIMIVFVRRYPDEDDNGKDE
jgi:hypothetical protein